MKNDCTDKRFEALLHAWELGFLTEEERAEIEQHLLDCSACFEKAQRLAPTVQLLKRDSEVSQAVESMDTPEKTEPSDTISVPDEKASRSLWRRIMPTSIAAAAVLALLLVKPWKVEITPDDVAIADGNRLAVMYFETFSDDAAESHLGEIATNLLITDLSESRFIHVVSSQHLHDLLKQVSDDENQKVVDKDIATQIARKARAKWILTGKILQATPNFVLTAQIVDVSSGNAVASQRVTGAEGDDIFAVVDKLTVEVKNDLSLPGEPDPLIADVTTHSAEAYHSYLEGLKLLQKFYRVEAAQSFQTALQYDSTFAMAWYHLAKLTDGQLTENAVKYADKASRKEQYFISSLEAQLNNDRPLAMTILQELIQQFPHEKTALRDLAILLNSEDRTTEALELYHRAIEIDPTYKEALNQLAYAYQKIGKHDSALITINQYIEIAPNDANPYDSRGDIFFAEKMFDEAIKSYQKALEIAPDFSATHYKLGPLLMIRGDFDSADSSYQWMANASRKTIRSAGRVYLAVTRLGRGHLNKALDVLDDGIAADRLEDCGGWNTTLKYYLKALIYLEQEQNNLAIESIDSCFTIHDRDSPLNMQCFRGLYIYALAEAGEISRSAESTKVFATFLDTNGIEQTPFLFARGVVALVSGDQRTMVEDLEKSVVWTVWDEDFFVPYFLARALLETGQTEDAAARFESLLDNGSSWRAYLEIWHIRSRLYLAEAYEKLERYDEARAQCEWVLDRWADADSGLAIIQEAQDRLSRLSQRP